MPITDPKVKIKTLLDGNWNSANTNGLTPKVHTGWYNSAWADMPQVTITNPVYTVRNGGETGITAIGGNATLVRFQVCTLDVDCWATREGTGVNPKDLTYNMSNEVRRIIEANMFSDSELELLTWLGMNEQVDTRVQPVVFRYNNSVRLMWKDAF